MTGRPMAAVCRTLKVARARHTCALGPGRGNFYRRAEDTEVVYEILAVTRQRASYGVRRTCAMVNRVRRERGQKPYNRKRIRRVMRMKGLTLPGKLRRRMGRPHTGKVAMPSFNQRWCSDGFNIRCWNADMVRVAFALDCHDREAIEHVAVPRPQRYDIRLLLDPRSGPGSVKARSEAPIEIQWLTTTAASTPRSRP